MLEGENRGSRLKDKVAIVTGGVWGIGRAFCLGMAGEGARIVASDIDLEAARATIEEIEAMGGEAMALETDISILEDTLEMARKTVERFGRIDILINNAAVISGVKLTEDSYYELGPDDWDRVRAVNLKGPFLCTRAVFPYMREQNEGKIINMASGTFFSEPDIFVNCMASRGGVIGLTRSLSAALAQYNINVNCITPGRNFGEGPDDEAAWEEYERRRYSQSSLKGGEYPEDLVGAAIFLASPDSDFITGQTIVVDDGMVS
jgi:3-oxoacyl-[acyl-carrier protein] reductase